MLLQALPPGRQRNQPRIQVHRGVWGPRARGVLAQGWGGTQLGSARFLPSHAPGLGRLFAGAV